MPEFWDQFEGLSIGDKYVVRGCLHKTEGTAYFLAAPAQGAERAILRLAAGEGAAARFSIWRRAMGFSHPNLMRVLDAGWLDWDGPRVAWAALEYPEENLGDVLQDRALAAEEARYALIAAAEALAYLHRQGMVHGEVAAWSIVAVGDAIKLSSDGIREPQANISPAEDVWSLGMAACEMLTRRLPEITRGEPQFSADEAPAVEPFREFIRRCLHPEPAKRWSAARLAAHLRDPQPEAAPVEAAGPVEAAVPVAAVAANPEPRPEPKAEVPARPEPVREPVAAPEPRPAPKPRAPIEMPIRPATRAAIPRWAYAAAGVVVAATALLVGMRHSSSKPTPVAVTQPAPTIARPVADEPAAPSAKAAEPPEARAPKKNAEVRPEHATGDWRVIAYTYNSARHAEQKARTINRRHPQFKAEVFTPQPHHAPYFVALGGRMSHEEAVQLQRLARSKGLPRDTFVRNYSR